MKKRIALVLVLAMLVSVLSGCCLKHEWMEADCTNPKTCAKCDKTEGEALGHDYIDATCAHPKTCERCGKTKGEALPHTWVEATCTEAKHCSVCNATEGVALGHKVSGGYISGSQLVGNCSVCGGEVSENITDWEQVANNTIVGYWEGVAMSNGTNTVDAPADTYLEFYEDGTALVVLGGDRYDGTWWYDFHDTSDDDPCLFFDSILDGDNFTIIIFDEDLASLYLVYDSLVVVYERP